MTVTSSSIRQNVSYTHGVITILDRPGLENAACECYEVAREQFDGLHRPVR